MVISFKRKGVKKLKTITNYDKSYDKEISLKISILILSFFASLLLLVWGPDLLGGVLALLVLVGIAWWLNGMQLMHPLTWFPPIFFMYSVSMPVLVIFGEEQYVDGLNYTLFVEWVALATFILVMGYPKKYRKVYNIDVLSNIKMIILPIYIVSVFLSAVYLIYIYSNGLSSKYAISLDQSIFSRFHIFFSILVLIFLILFTYKLIVNKRIPKLLLLFTTAFSFLILIIAGERDILLRVVLGAIVLIHFFHRKIRKRYLITIGLLGIMSIPVLSNLKNFAFGERTIDNDKTFISDIFNGEFRSASRNLNTLINNQDGWSYFYGETIIWDLKIATIFDAVSPGAWFNQTFYPNLVARGGGNGFSLVGEGYMNFGTLGVVLWFAMLGLLLKYLYKKAHVGLIWSIIYIALIPIVVYSIRGDFATILTHFTKHIAFPLILIYFIKLILEKKPIVLKKSMKNAYSLK